MTPHNISLDIPTEVSKSNGNFPILKVLMKILKELKMFHYCKSCAQQVIGGGQGNYI